MVNFVFLHGGEQGGWVWDETIAAIRQQTNDAVECLALDGPGCGSKRERDTAGMTFEAVNLELVADIEAAKLVDVVLIGHSQAGIHLPAMTAIRPELFSRLIFVAAIAPDPGLSMIDTVREQMLDPAQVDNDKPAFDPQLTPMENYRDMFCSDMGPSQTEAFLDRLGDDHWPLSCSTQNQWSRGHLSNFAVSYIVCWRDRSLPRIWQERFAEKLHAKTVASIDAGHQVMNTRPHSLAETLLIEAGATSRPLGA